MITTYLVADATDWSVVGDEQMGAKPKVWLYHPTDASTWLFKSRHRHHSGDDWSEKAACELAKLIGLPCAEVHLAQRRGRGVVCRNLLGDPFGDELIPGNRMLLQADPAYPAEHRFHGAKHTIGRIFSVLAAQRVGVPDGASGPADGDARGLFTGYLLFDTWIANTDRHHENWAVIKAGDGRLTLSPSYDHASSLGHNLNDGERDERLTTRDRNRQMPAFVVKARSAVYASEADTKSKALSTDQAYRLAAELSPAAARYWLDKLRAVRDSQVTDILERVPDDIMSSLMKRFAAELLRLNRARLLANC